jgi:hypothetical protein
MPSSSGISLFEKYQVAVETIITNSLQERMNAMIQKYPNIIIQSMFSTPYP